MHPNKVRAGRALAWWLLVLLLGACAGGGSVVTTGGGGPSNYSQTLLDFIPHAINDQNLVVGVKGAKAVRFSGGILTTLPFLPITGAPYVAIDVNRFGNILGATNVQQVPAVYWIAPSYPISGWLEEPPVGVFEPKALNQNLMVVGNSGDAVAAFRWTQAGGYKPLLVTTAEQNAIVNDVNDSGVAVGRTPLGDLLIWGATATVAIRVAALVRSGPFILSDGTVLWSDGSDVLSRSTQGSIVRRPIPVDGVMELTGVSEVGRLIGTVTLNGVTKGWTVRGDGAVLFLTPANPQADEHLKPVGVNRCGNIVSQRVQGVTPVSGAFHAKTLICDQPDVINTQ